MGTNLYLCVASLTINGQAVSVQKQVRAPSPALANGLFQYFLPELLLARGITILDSDVVEGGVNVHLEDDPRKTRNM